MCIYPTLGKNKKYTKNKKNGGIIPAVYDKRTEYVPYACGNCMECRKQKAREWQVRLLEDIKTNKNGKFITLTFSNESIKEIVQQTIKKTNPETGRIEEIQIETLKGYSKDNAVAIRAIHNLRNRWKKKYKKTIRHWFITELGHKGTENIHMHGIVWTEHFKDRDKRGLTLNELKDQWQYGFIYNGKIIMGQRQNYVNNATINYMIKYVSKIDLRNKEYKPKILSSPGIGKEYINTHNATKNEYKGKDTKETYRTQSGHLINLPPYWRNKLYTEEEKERLWINKLDKKERWVDGQKIDVSNGQEAYEKAVQEARRKNNELGYGGQTNHNRKKYEEQRRDIMNETRIRKAMNSSKTQEPNPAKNINSTKS